MTTGPTNRNRASNCARRLSRLLELNAPMSILLTEWGMLNERMVDCLKYGIDSTDNKNKHSAEIVRSELLHEQGLCAGPDKCGFCSPGKDGGQG